VPLLLAVASEEAKARFLPAIASGEVAAAVAWGAIGEIDPLRTADVRAEAVGDGYRLDGRVAQVVDLPAANLVLVPAWLDGAVVLFALEPEAGFDVRPLKTLDATRPLGELALRGLVIPAAARIDKVEMTADVVSPALTLANLGLAAEQLGAARGVMDMTLAYVAERVQFGRTIASFQAIKHRCARLEVDLAEARALLYGAAAGEVVLEVSAVRALASDLLYRAAEEAIQMHGGVGFTWEYDPHLYFKRAQATHSLLSTPEAHLERIAAAIVDGVTA
jgi:acyl-CoA dehydrogenase